MIIPFKEIPETREGFPCTAFRWTFQIHHDLAGFIHQHQMNDEWFDSHTRVWTISLMKDWMWGQYHVWYDGPHCLFSIGPLRIQWHNDNCEKCM